MPQEGTLDSIINKNYINDTKEINYNNFQGDVLRDICNDIKDIKNRKSVKKTSEASIESCSLNHLEQINILKGKLNSKSLIVNKLLETADKFDNHSSLHEYCNATLKTLLRVVTMLKITLQSVL